jgi:mannose-6-phosphate isomerase-like protein (cupin superfamily)
MEGNPMEQKVRRIVTGHNAQGMSMIVSDTTAVMERTLHELWVTDGTPARFGGAPELGALPTNLEPSKGGTVVRFVRFMPSPNLSQEEAEQNYAKGFAAINASHARVDTRRHPAMHKTHSLDYGIVLAGRIKLLMDEGELELKPFDVVIQRGTNHGWVNPGPEPALMAFMLIDGTE